MASPYTVAEEMLGAASAQRNLGGMQRTAAPMGPNMYDSGPASKVGANTQPFNNARMREQGILQNTGSAASQASVDAVNDIRKQQLVMDNAEYSANFAADRKKEVMTALGSPATQMIGDMTPVEGKSFRDNNLFIKAQAMGMNPDLMANAIEGAKYLKS